MIERHSEPALQEIRDVWSWALSWYIKGGESAKHEKQTAVIRALLTELRHLDTLTLLDTHYGSDARWVVVLTRRLYPTDWATLGMHAMAAAAYGIRYMEIVYGLRRREGEDGLVIEPEELTKGQGRVVASEWACW